MVELYITVINNMNNKQTTLILGWIFLIAGIFSSYGINIICSSIFFSAHFIIETLEKNRNSNLKPFLVRYDYILSNKSTIILAFDYNDAVEKFKKEFEHRYYTIKEITEQNGNNI